jgi:hypothetical protein
MYPGDPATMSDVKLHLVALEPGGVNLGAECYRRDTDEWTLDSEIKTTGYVIN